MTVSRFNLSRLRGLTAVRLKSRVAEIKAAPLSRRSFLGLWGSGIALGSVSAFPGFRVVREGSRVHVLTGEQPAWTIDPAVFGSSSRVAVEEAAHDVTISLADAFFPGTLIPAGFTCRLSEANGAWTLQLAMDCGIEVSSPLISWLNGKAAARGTWAASGVRPFPGLSVAFDSNPSVQFSPDWGIAVEAQSTVRVAGLSDPLPAPGFEILLNSDTPLVGAPPERSTTFLVARHGQFWNIDLTRESESGWSFEHNTSDPLFDEFQAEAACLDGRVERSALLLQGEGNAGVLRFRPGGTLCSDRAEPFSLPLENARLAFGLETEKRSSFIADLGAERVWAHGASASYLFGPTPEAPRFELHAGPAAPGTPQVSPGICEICFPSDESCVTLKLGKARPVPFTWADLGGPFARLAGWLHLLPSQHGHELAIDLEHGARLVVERPRDMLSLQFGFDSMRLVTGASPRIVHVHGKPEPRVKVYFPPQHVAEQAYFHTDDPPDPASSITKVDVPIGKVELTDYADPSVTTVDQLKREIYEPDILALPTAGRDPLPAGATMSGETQLIFGLPPHCREIPCAIEALLDWNEWLPVVAPVAQSKATITDTSNLPRIVSPFDQGPYTAIELPYRLDLSPSELGRWAHSIPPVESKDKKVAELWHTRLGVLPKKAGKKERSQRTIADEDNGKDRTVRAIWSPDFQAVDPLKCDATPPLSPRFVDHYTDGTPARPESPFRMSLDARDRCELVHLTSNYAITQQVHFCENGPIPPDRSKLQAPAPVQVNRMILTPMGGYLDLIGQWNPAKVDFTHQLTIQLWKHHATLGRDHYVKVLYKGYLMPFGLRASLVKVTQRYFQKNSGSWVAVLHQHMYIIVKNERKQFPVMGQPFGGREFPFVYVEPVTLTTPFLYQPDKQKWPRDASRSQSQSLFWPMTDAVTVFKFRLRFTDITGLHSAESSMPLVFAASDVAQQADSAPSPNSSDAVRLYNGGANHSTNGDDDRLLAKFGGQKFSFARNRNPGDIDFETDTMVWRADLPNWGAGGPSAIELYRYDLPFFYPAVDYTRISSTGIKRVTGDSDPKKFVFFPTYLTDGFDARANVGEVVLQKSTDDSLKLAFGGSGKVDQSGGLASPDVLVVGFSRKTGVVGGKTDSSTTRSGRTVLTSASTFSAGVFNAADFFGGLLSAKLLGAVKLADIVAPLAPDLISNLEKAPQMIEQALYEAGDAEQKVFQYIQTVVGAIRTFQAVPANPIAARAASQAQQLFAASDALTAAIQASSPDLIKVGVLEGQAIARIVDYGKAVAGALQDPASLVEETILDALNQALQDFLSTSGIPGAIAQQLNSIAAQLNETLDTAIQAVNGAIDSVFNKLNNTTIPDPLTQAAASLATLAPEIKNLLALKPTVVDLKNKVLNLAQSIRATTNPFSLQPLLEILADLSGIAADVQQIYQKAGFAGIVAKNATVTSVAANLNTAQTKLRSLWILPDYTPALDAFQTDCVKLASAYPAANAEAQLVLQNLRQLQKAVARAKALRSNKASGAQAEYRRLQLLQKVQGHILQSLSAIQTLANVPFPAGTAPTVIAAAASLRSAAPVLAASLTVVTQLLTGPTAPEQLVAAVLADPILAKPLAAAEADLRLQLASLRAQIAASPAVVSLQVLYYNLCLDYQRAVASAQSYLLYLQLLSDAVLTLAFQDLFAVVAPIEALAVQLQQSLCALQPLWMQFVTKIEGIQGPLNGAVKIGPIIKSAFGDDLNAITAAFTALCGAATPSEFLADSQKLATAFVTLETDVRSKVPGLLASALTDALTQAAQQLLDQLAQDVPIPTSVNLSYAWQPTIQSVEPIFIVNDGGAFTVTASVQAGLNLQQGGIAASVDISAELTNFSIKLIGEETFITLVIKSLKFTSHNGSKPDCRLTIDRVEFGAAMEFVQELADALDPSEGPFIELADSSIRAGFRFAIDSLTVGAFNIMQLAIEVAVALPFDGTPVRCEFNLSDQQQPFLLSSGIFGGGGFLQILLGLDGVQLLQGALEFGVCASVSIGPLQGSGFVVAGIYFRISSNQSEVCGFVHAHGHMDIFGIISMDVDLYVAICYAKDSAGNSVVTGIATFSVSISIAFFSETFTMQAQYTFAGSGSSPSQVQSNDDAEALMLDGPSDSINLFENRPAQAAAAPRKTHCPGPWKAGHFIDQNLWSQYYDSFA